MAVTRTMHSLSLFPFASVPVLCNTWLHLYGSDLHCEFPKLGCLLHLLYSLVV